MENMNIILGTIIRPKSVLALIYIAAMFILCARACLGQDGARQTDGAFNYSLYKSQSNTFLFSFAYPSDWNVNDENAPDSNNLVFSIVMPGSGFSFQNRFSAAIILMVSPTKERGGLLSGIDEKAGLYLRSGEKVLLNESVLVGGVNGYEVVTQRTTGLVSPSEQASVQSVDVTNHRILLEKDGYIYNIDLAANSNDYQLYRPVIEEIKRTFKFSK